MLRITDLQVDLGNRRVLDGVSLNIGKGSSILVCGAGGEGKSTLLAAACGVIPRLVQADAISGTIELGGRSLGAIRRAELFQRIGIVFQNLDDQLWDLDVEDVVVAPLENRGMPREAVRERLAALFEEFRLHELSGRRVLTLSGGERRLVVLASALAATPDPLMLDEPTTGLDPEARLRLRRALLSIRSRIPAVLAAEQDVGFLLDAFETIHLLKDGRIAACRPRHAAGSPQAEWRENGLVPPRRRAPRSLQAGAAGSVLLEAEGLRSALRRAAGEPVLDDVSLQVRAGEVVGLVGRNGAGKSTLIKTLLGLSRLEAGSIHILSQLATDWTTARRARQVAYLPQNTRRMFFNMTVASEVAFAMSGEAERRGEARTRERILAVLSSFGLVGKAEDSPFALSEREQSLLGLACAEASNCPLTILDEPLIARDLKGRAVLDRFLDAAVDAGRSILLISHDLDLVDDVCARLLVLRAGRIEFDGQTEAGWQSPAFGALGWPAPDDRRGEAA